MANKAGGSFKSVSRVFNNGAAVNESIREKVLAAEEAPDYHPSILAHSLRFQRTSPIGFFTDQIAAKAHLFGEALVW